MGAYAPDALMWLQGQIVAAIPTAEFSGIVGDAAHSFGYHLARNDLPSSDYSVQLADDKLGDGNAASALDISYGPQWMRTITARLQASARDQADPRLNYIREFAGTLDGSQTYAYDTYYQQDSYGQWDDSHLWHVHISFLRRYCNDMTAAAAVLSVVRGETVAQWRAGGTTEEDDMALRDTDDGIALIYRMDALVHGRPTVTLPLKAGARTETLPLVQKIDQLLAGQAASAARETALGQAFTALAGKGTSVDTAAVLDAVKAVGDQAGAAAQRIADLEAELADRDARLAAALGGQTKPAGQ